MLDLLTLPFRGLWRMVTGFLCALPILLVIAAFTVSHWISYAFNQFIYCKTGFRCHVESCHFDAFQGNFSLKNISINNSDKFSSSDWIKIHELSFQIPLVNLFKKTIDFEQISLKFHSFVSVNEGSKNNIQEFVSKFMNSSSSNSSFSRGIIIRNLTICMAGPIGFRYYTANNARVAESVFNKTYTFSNVCCNISKEEKENLLSNTDFEKVYNEVTTNILLNVNTFKN